ncbi:uncharacterized protein LOC128260163 isoform X2 [Drosophila gunungcola]|uniref:uncharacterized protein LOC128260163 isoform X2 n=1 Tax=Drosophila gunungcola TaxID=103775 RepID=UPI0022E94565|nr:uncharacterized protein LOC128260163 isoform X2 [Drosophila gunungcola]
MGKHKLSSGSVSSKNPDESVSSKDRSNKVTKDKFEEDQPRKFCRRRCFVESSGHVEYRNGRNAKEKVFKTSFNHKEQSYQSKTEDFSDEKVEDVPQDVEYISSEQDEMHSGSHISHQSTDCSKSFSQIYSEIFEESKERQEKAERACRAYNINKSKLRRTLEVCGSGGPGSGNYESSWESEYSSKLTKSSQEYDNLSVQGQLQSINGSQEKDSLIHEKKISKNHRLKRSKIPVNKPEHKHRWSSHRNQESKKLCSHRPESMCSADSSFVSKHECSGFSFSSVCSRSRKYHSEDYSAVVTDGSDYPADGRGDSSTGIPTTATSQSRSQRDYLSSGSTRHRLHHHNRRQRSVPKTYQDRGNSPINIKTRRKTHDYHELCSEIGTEKVRKGLLGRSSASVGVQYPSEDEIEDQNSEQCLPIEFDSHEDCLLSAKEMKVMSTINSGKKPFQDIEISNIDHRSVTTEEDLDMYDDELTDNVDLELYDKEEAYNDEYSHDTEINDEKKDLSDEYDQFGQKPDDEVEYIKSDQELSTEYEQDLSLGQQEIFDKESEQSKKSAEVKPKSPLSLKIYNADEALMEIPEDFEGSAVVLDDDADFLDITLTDDEEQIRAKLMAAALTTRRSGCSISASSGLKSRRSTESRSSILSYKPSVIFTRRSEVIEDENVPRRNNRVALLAEQVLRSVSKSHTEEPEWQPLMEQVSDPELNKQPLAERELFKKFTSDLTDSGTPLCVDRQLLSKEFNKKLQRQLKSIVETFQ